MFHANRRHSIPRHPPFPHLHPEQLRCWVTICNSGNNQPMKGEYMETVIGTRVVRDTVLELTDKKRVIFDYGEGARAEFFTQEDAEEFFFSYEEE